LKAVAELNLQLPPGDRLSLSRDTRLVGTGGKLDSLALINLIVGVEQHVSEDLGVNVVLTEDRTLAHADRVMATVGALAEHIDLLISEKGPGGTVR
jgi:acyl carrier protein